MSSMNPTQYPSLSPTTAIGLSQSSNAASVTATVPAYVIPIIVVPLLVGLIGMYFCVRYIRRARKEERVGQWMGGAIAMTVQRKKELNVEDVYSNDNNRSSYLCGLDKQSAQNIDFSETVSHNQYTANPLKNDSRLSESLTIRKSLQQTDTNISSTVNVNYIFTNKTNPIGLD